MEQHRLKVKFGNYEINSVFVGKIASPLDPSNSQNHVIKVKNTQLNKWASFDYWAKAGRIGNQKELLIAFKSLLLAGSMGALPEDAFCVMMKIQEFTGQNRSMYEECKGIDDRMKNLIERDTSVKEIVQSLIKAGI